MDKIKAEFRQIHTPTKKQVAKNTAVTLGISIACSLLLFGVQAVITELVKPVI